MQRLRLIDCRLSRLPDLLGLCQNDRIEIANWVNAAQQRLLFAKEASDESWNGTWAEIRINASRHHPYITFPREVARLEAVDICDRPVQLFNQFYEYLQFGNGRMQKDFLTRCHRPMRAVYSRNNAVLFNDLSPGPQIIGIYTTDTSDVGVKRVLVQGLDQNGQPVYSQDNNQQVMGEFVTLATPFATTKNQFTLITGIQKDITNGTIQFVEISPSTAQQSPILTMEPGEQTASYRRYFFSNLPCTCCAHQPDVVHHCVPVQVTALVKLDLIPVVADTDYLLLSNLEAIIEESQAAWFGKVQNLQSQQLAQVHHTNAIRFLNGELGHFQGVNNPAVRISYFGSARLERRRIGTMI